MHLQRTIRQEATFSGIGLHTGRQTAVRLMPAPRDTGIVFHRVDKGVYIRANISAVCETAFATTLGHNGIRIRTVEHLLASLSGLGINNLIVEVDGPEIPIMDGSASAIVQKIAFAGVAGQGKPMPVLRILRPVVYEDSHARISAFPYEGTRISGYIHFSHHLLGEQTFTTDVSDDIFVKDIAPARTFGFLKDVEKLRANGLARGGSLSNAVIVGDTGILNDRGLRFADEFVRHKILDAIGDLSLAGLPVYGHIVLEKAGHTSHIAFLRKLLSSPECYEIVSRTESAVPASTRN